MAQIGAAKICFTKLGADGDNKVGLGYQAFAAGAVRHGAKAAGMIIRQDTAGRIGGQNGKRATFNERVEFCRRPARAAAKDEQRLAGIAQKVGDYR